MAKRGLGRGIDALLQAGSSTEELAADGLRIIQLSLSELSADPDQPRKEFDEASLSELAESIREKGVLQPILVSQVDGAYRIIAGERRFRATKLAGLSEIPAIIRDFSEQERREVALIENIQRTDLNPLEEAAAYRELLTLHGLSQEVLAQRLGKSRSSIANAMRLLKLPTEVQDAIRSGALSSGHARALLSIADDGAKKAAFDAILDANLSVRDAEALAKLINNGADPAQALPQLRGAAESSLAASEFEGENTGITEAEFEALTNMSGKNAAGKITAKPGSSGSSRSLEIQEIEELLITRLGTKVSVRGNHRSGKIEIRYFSLDDLERLLEIMGASSH